MAFETPPRPYKRGIPPVQPESLPKYYQEELRKAEEAITSLVNAAGELDSRKAQAQANSTAIDVAGIVADFNSLLAKLRTAGLMS